MRKVFSVVVLIALTAGMVWAQDEEAGVLKIGAGELTISGVVKGGLRADGDTSVRYSGDDEFKKAADVYGYSDDIDDGTAIRGDLTATYTLGPVGARIRLRDNIAGPDQGFKAQSAYGWVNLFGEKVVVTGGIIGDDVWGTGALGGTGTDTSYDDQNVRLAIQPIPGLTFGASWGLGKSFDSLKESGRTNGSDNPATPTHHGNGVGEFFGDTVIGALYSNDYFGLNVSLRLNHGFYVLAEDKTFGRGADLLFGFKLTAVPKLTLIVDGQISKLGLDKDSYGALANAPDYWRWMHADGSPKTTDDGWIYQDKPTSEIYAKVAYQVLDPLSIGLRFHEKGIGGVGDSDIDDSIVKTDFDLRLFADFAVKEWVIPGIHFQADFKGLTKNAQDINDDADDENKIGALSTFHIQPKCTFKLAGVTFNIWDDIGIVMAQGQDNIEEGIGWHSVDKDGKPAGYIKNRFQIDFIWTF